MNNDTTPTVSPDKYLDEDVNGRRLADYTREANIDKNTDELEDLNRVCNALIKFLTKQQDEDLTHVQQQLDTANANLVTNRRRIVSDQEWEDNESTIFDRLKAIEDKLDTVTDKLESIDSNTASTVARVAEVRDNVNATNGKLDDVNTALGTANGHLADIVTNTTPEGA